MVKHLGEEARDVGSSAEAEDEDVVVVVALHQKFVCSLHVSSQYFNC